MSKRFGKLDAELRALGLRPEGIDGHQLLKLQADAAAMPERFGHRCAIDYLGDTSLELKINSPYPEVASSIIYRRGPNQIGDHFEWAKCEAVKGRRASFLQCNLLDADVTSMKEVLVLMHISVDATLYGELEQRGRDWWRPLVEKNVSRRQESFFLIRPMSVSSECRYLICSGDYTFCEVRVQLRQIAPLDAFEAQMEVVWGLMEDIEQEKRRLLDLSSPLDTENGTCAEPAATKTNATGNVKGGSTTRIGGLYIHYIHCDVCTFLLVLPVIVGCFCRT